MCELRIKIKRCSIHSRVTHTYLTRTARTPYTYLPRTARALHTYITRTPHTRTRTSPVPHVHAHVLHPYPTYTHTYFTRTPRTPHTYLTRHSLHSQHVACVYEAHQSPASCDSNQINFLKQQLTLTQYYYFITIAGKRISACFKRKYTQGLIILFTSFSFNITLLLHRYVK